MGSPQPTPAASTGLPPGVEPGDVGKRVVAYLIEWAAPAVVIWVLSLIGALAQNLVLSLIIGVVSLLAVVGWVIFVWWGYATKAAGPGKKAMGLQLVGFSDGRPLGWGRVILRWLVLGVIAGTGIGAILLLVFTLQNPRRQSWADQIVDSVVIKGRALAPTQLPPGQQQAMPQQPAPSYQPQASPTGPAAAGDRGGYQEHGVQTPVRYGQADRYGREQYGAPAGDYQQAQQAPYTQQDYQQDQPQQQGQYGQDQYAAQPPPQQDQYQQPEQYGQQEQYPPSQYPQDQYAAQDQYGQDQYPQGEYGQDQYAAQDQYSQDQYQQEQPAQDQFQQDQYQQDQYGQDQYQQGGPGVTPVPAPIPGATQFPAAAPPPVSGGSATSAREPDPRPLNEGWLAALDDGREIDVDGLILLGRNPQARPGEEDAQLIKIADESRTVSKTHLAIGVDAGGIYVMDRGSTNGSTATDPGGQSRPCAPGDVVQVDVGSIVSFGDHWLEIKRP